MKIEATKLTAGLAGAWGAFGLLTFGKFTLRGFHDGSINGALHALVMVVFFFAPFFIFVIGPQPGGFRIRQMLGFMVRCLCYGLGAGIVAIALVPLLSA